MRKLIVIMLFALSCGCEKPACYQCETVMEDKLLYSVEVCDKTPDEIEMIRIGMEAQYRKLTKGPAEARCFKK